MRSYERLFSNERSFPEPVFPAVPTVDGDIIAAEEGAREEIATGFGVTRDAADHSGPDALYHLLVHPAVRGRRLRR
jgi:hypothetical protein